MKMKVLLIITVIAIGSINAQDKAFGSIYFGMNKKEVRKLKYVDTLKFDNYSFIVNLKKSKFDNSNNLLILDLWRIGDVFERFDQKHYSLLVNNIFSTLSKADYKCLFKNVNYDSGLLSKNETLFIFQNEIKTILVNNTGSYYNGVLDYITYYVRFQIVSNDIYNSLNDVIKANQETNIENAKSVLD